MRLIRFMLIDLALMLVVPESAEATISYWADFKSAREAVGSLMPISGRGPVQLWREPASLPPNLSSRAIRTFSRRPRRGQADQKPRAAGKAALTF